MYLGSWGDMFIYRRTYITVYCYKRILRGVSRCCNNNNSRFFFFREREKLNVHNNIIIIIYLNAHALPFCSGARQTSERISGETKEKNPPRLNII